MKIGIFGGSFDPIHYGHLITAIFLVESKKLDKLIFIPCHISPHKLEKEYASDEHRFNMVKLAIKDVEYFDVSDIEIKKNDISYTIDTLRELKKIYREDELFLIIGYDNLLVFDKWKDPDEILKLSKVLVLRRISSLPEIKNIYADKVEIVNAPIIQISSSEIRDRLRANKTIKYLTPDSVIEYIIKNKLYVNQ